MSTAETIEDGEGEGQRIFRLGAEKWLDAVADTLDRLVLAAILYVLIVMNILALGRVLTDAEAADLQNLFVVAGTTIGAFEATSMTVMLWTVLPLVTVVIHEMVVRIRGGSA